eukprot:TRINITY_DN502_c1_g2_i1.p1 TRINITY_DN502_c1_g2~~TRINITY_DN502_c1_g2_i1.p1  ORF type:complete len:1109 (-),score=239.20 TRINITY_DN502_c1_g2_i1:399-3725(-)
MTYGAQKQRAWNNLKADIQKTRLKMNNGIRRAELPALPPEGEKMKEVAAEAQANVNSLQKALRREALERHRARMLTKRRFEWVADKNERPKAFVNIANNPEDENWTCNNEEMDEAVKKYWGDIWSDDVPRDEELEKAFLDCIPRLAEFKMENITGDDIKRALAKANGVAGPDGWRIDELKMVPELYESLAEVFTAVEAAGTMPSIARLADVSLIPKTGEAAHFTKMRPISVTATLHRLYAAVRLRKTLMPWQEQVAGSKPLMACRKEASTKDLTWMLALQMEADAWRGAPTKGAAYDLSKAFDTLPLGREGVLWEAMQRAGFPLQIVVLMRDMYSGFSRRFKHNGVVGTELKSVQMRGALQGCSFSMIAMNTAVMLWFWALDEGLRDCADDKLAQMVRRAGYRDEEAVAEARRCKEPASKLTRGGYADDIHVASSDGLQVSRAHCITVAWATALGMKLNAVKSLSFNKALALDGTPFPEESIFKLLGDRLDARYAEDEERAVESMENKRSKECRKRLKRIEMLPTGRKIRAATVATSALPTLYSQEFTPLANAENALVRREVWKSIRGGHEEQRAAAYEVLFSVFEKGHLVDPSQAMDYRTVVTFARLARYDSAANDNRRLVWQKLRDTTVDQQKPGPFKRMSQVLESLRWKWSEHDVIRTEEGEEFKLPVRGEKMEELKHKLRAALRDRETSSLVSDNRPNKQPARADFKGIERGIAEKETRAIMPSLPPYEAGMLMRICSGGAYTRERYHRHGYKGLAADPYCRAPSCLHRKVAETKTHRYWDCPQYEELRPEWFRRLRQHVLLLPAAIVESAVLPKGYGDFPITLLQRVYLDIEKVARDFALEKFNPPPVEQDEGDEDAQLPPQPPQQGERSHRPSGHRMPDNSHPPELIENGPTRLTCKRCKRSVLHTSHTFVREFWRAECFDNSVGATVNTYLRGNAAWESSGKAQAQATVDRFSKEHGGSVRWSGLKFGSVRCLVCEERHLLLRLQEDDRRGRKKWQKCCGDKQTANKDDKDLDEFVKEYNKKFKGEGAHKWKKKKYTAHCGVCGLCVHKVKNETGRSSSALDAANCGKMTASANGYYARMAQHFLITKPTEEVYKKLHDPE